MHTVTLPRCEESPLLWPDCCIVCGEPRPGHGTSIKVERAFLRLAIGAAPPVEVPCCRHCERKLRWRKVVDVAAFIVGAGAAFLIVWLAGWWTSNRGQTKLIFLGTFLVISLPWILWRGRSPLEVNERENTVTYEFADGEFGRLFERANVRDSAAEED